MSIKMPSWVEPSVWGLVVGVAGCWILLASAFGWISPAEAAKTSAQKVQNALVAYATPGCVNRFEHQANAAAAWQKLKKTDDWSRGDLVVKDGWVSGPGQKLDSDTASAVGSLCATKILALKSVGGTKLGMN